MRRSSGDYEISLISYREEIEEIKELLSGVKIWKGEFPIVRRLRRIRRYERS